MRVKRVIGATMAALSIFLVIFYGYMACSNQQSYVRLMCAADINDKMMLGMGLLGVGFVLIATDGILLAKSRR